uniref:Leucine rich repeat containing 30a n=1 Tax=Electrophorus electricus TaxID=8005 RepID=A0A4W4HFS8_ELEEL
HSTSLTEIQERIPASPTLGLAARGLDEAPCALWQMRELEKLNLSLNRLCALPPALGAFHNLVVLNLWGNELTSLPPEIGMLRSQRALFTHCNRLSAVPEELGRCDELEVLSLAGNQLTTLPGGLATAHRLAELNLGHNRMDIDERIRDLASLKILIVEENRLRSLLRALCHLTALELLNVDFNNLQNVPGEMYRLWRLEKLASHPLDKGLHIVHNALLKPIQDLLQGGLDALFNYLKPA